MAEQGLQTCEVFVLSSCTMQIQKARKYKMQAAVSKQISCKQISLSVDLASIWPCCCACYQLQRRDSLHKTELRMLALFPHHTDYFLALESEV